MFFQYKNYIIFGLKFKCESVIFAATRLRNVDIVM